MLGRDVVAVGRKAAEVGRARRRRARATSRRGSAESGCRRRAASRALRRSAPSCRRSKPAWPSPAAALRRRAAARRHRQYAEVVGRVVAISRRLLAVVARVRHEVLQDHFLDVAVLARAAARSPRSASMRSSAVSPMPTRMPVVNGTFSSPAARSSPGARADAWSASPVDRLHQALGDRLEHQPLRRGDLAQALHVVARASRRDSCAAGCRARARARRPRRRNRRSPRARIGQRAEHRGCCLGAPRRSGSAAPWRASRRVVEQLLDLVGPRRCGWCVANAQYLQ